MILITGKTYDRLKALAQVVLPALGTLYFALAGLWGLPSADAVVGTVVAFDAFLGALLSLSQAAYAKSGQKYDGAIYAGEEHDDGMQNFHLKIPLAASEVIGKDALVLKVHNTTTGGTPS